MSDHDERRFVRRAELIFKLVLAALIGLWIAFPPQASQPSAAKPAVAAQVLP